MTDKPQTNLFDYAEGLRLRDLGLSQVSSYPNDSWIESARKIAIFLANKYGEVTINDVYKILPRPENMHPNASGPVMRCKELRQIGFRQSEKTTRRCGTVRVYAPAI